MHGVDWDDLRFYLALIRSKSLAGAAKELHVTQSTVGRRLATLEERLGVRLVHRTQEGYLPTLAGEAIRQHIERVEAEMHSVERAVGGLDTRLAGNVRVASNPLLTSHVLAPCATALYTRHAEIRMELIASTAIPDLAAREADISVQLSRCNQDGLVVRRIGTLAFGLYASLSYLSQHGEPQLHDGLSGHRLLTLIDTSDLPEQAKWLAEVARHSEVLLRTNSRETLLWAALQGAGLALLPRFRGDTEAALRPVRIPTPVPRAEVWLSVHEGMRRVPRVRAVLDCVTETFRLTTNVMDAGDGLPAIR